jgi:hypothetical protein
MRKTATFTFHRYRGRPKTQARLLSCQPDYLRQLEEVMTLLAFKDKGACPVAHLLDLAQRSRTAAAVNAAILVSQYQEAGEDRRDARGGGAAWKGANLADS